LRFALTIFSGMTILFRVCRGLRAAPNALSQFGLRFSFAFVSAFPVYRISAKGARVENPHETKG
ncbi:MAG: hypothetical protein KAY35_04125, partial [Faecalibacterium sp.]|nr:hypothetical protein [Faecalibacterium sp.]